MRELIEPIQAWLEQGKAVALATVIRTWGSSPRQAGAGMAVSANGEIIGSVSGGCVEGAVVESAIQVIKTGEPVCLHFGVADAEAWEVGLSCGGEIDVFVRPFTPKKLDVWKRMLSSENQAAMAIILEGDASNAGREMPADELASEPGLEGEISKTIGTAAREVLLERNSKVIPVNSSQIRKVFFYHAERTPDLVLVGGAHIAVALAAQAKALGYGVVVIDPRRLFGTEERFPEVDRILAEWPESAFTKLSLRDSTAIVMLTHDPKIDDPALRIALSSPAFYIGALGSKKTHQKRVDRLREQGFSAASLERIHAPVGLDLGAVTPEEIALSILAELVQVWRKGKETHD